VYNCTVESSQATDLERLHALYGEWARGDYSREYIQSGDRILVLIHRRGRGKGSGAQIEGRGAHLWTFREGLAVRFDTYRDRDQARAALGGG
jgi:ketosteroid isomerase-like protein